MGDRPLKWKKGNVPLKIKINCECKMTEREAKEYEMQLKKTILSDFLEKYPSAKLSDLGIPDLCIIRLGYKKAFQSMCRKPGTCLWCWNRPLEEVK